MHTDNVIPLDAYLGTPNGPEPITTNDVYKRLRFALMHSSHDTGFLLSRACVSVPRSRYRGWSYAPGNRRYVTMSEEELTAYVVSVLSYYPAHGPDAAVPAPPLLGVFQHLLRRLAEDAPLAREQFFGPDSMEAGKIVITHQRRVTHAHKSAGGCVDVRGFAL